MTRILEHAILAPSGENAQPWKFRVYGTTIEVFNIPERDTSVYNTNQRGSLVAHGALIENIVVASSEEGYAVRLKLFPSGDSGPVASIEFQKQQHMSPNPLAAAIKNRCTNRKTYSAEPLPSEIVTELQKSVSDIKDVDVVITSNKNTIAAAASGASVNEFLLFQNRGLHDFFFNHINWTEKEDRQKSIGFSLMTLELPPPAQFIFKLARHAGIASLLNTMGFSKIVAQENEKIYRSAGALGAISLLRDVPESYVNAGRALERIWLEVTSRGFSMQVVAGLCFLAQAVNQHVDAGFTVRESKLVADAYLKIQEAFTSFGKTTVLLFRIGKGGFPSARSSRLPPHIEQI